jgi:hypothetical protein
VTHAFNIAACNYFINPDLQFPLPKISGSLTPFVQVNKISVCIVVIERTEEEADKPE